MEPGPQGPSRGDTHLPLGMRPQGEQGQRRLGWEGGWQGQRRELEKAVVSLRLGREDSHPHAPDQPGSQVAEFPSPEPDGPASPSTSGAPGIPAVTGDIETRPPGAAAALRWPG